MAHLFAREGLNVDALVARLQQMCSLARSRRVASEVPLDIALVQRGWSVETAPAQPIVRADLVNLDPALGLTWTRAHIDRRDFSIAIARPLTVVPSPIAAVLAHASPTAAFSPRSPAAASPLIALAVAGVMALLPVSAQERWRRCAVPLPSGLLIGHIEPREGWRLTKFSSVGAAPAWRRFETLKQDASEEGARSAFAGQVESDNMAAGLSAKSDSLRMSRMIVSRCQQLGTRPVHLPGR